MDLRTLLLVRTHTVVLDPDRVASAATRPARDADFDKFEDELVQLGFIMSLDLAMTIRRLPHQANQDLREWVSDTLVASIGARPQVPLTDGLPNASVYLRRVATWLRAHPEQPCPWCGQQKHIAPLDPCGHVVCRSCWEGGTYAGCPVCHRRVAAVDPFVRVDQAPVTGGPITGSDGRLRLLYLGFDLVGAARSRFEGLVLRAAPLPADDRAELEVVIDTMGPKTAAWLPARIPMRETMATVVARLWMVAPDRTAMLRTTGNHLRTATDVLRVAVVLMGGDPGLVEPMRLRSISRGLRRIVLAALDRLPADSVVEDVRRHASLWKRVGERIHPSERARNATTSSLAFAVVRRTKLTTNLGDPLRAAAARCATLEVLHDELHVHAWIAPVEDALRRGDPSAALARLVERPDELLGRVDHVVRAILEHADDAQRTAMLWSALSAIGTAVRRGAPAALLLLASHVTARKTPWPRRVMLPRGDARPWTTADTRRPLEPGMIDSITAAIRNELVARAETRNRFPRAVIDRALVERLLPIGAVQRWGRAVARAGAIARPTVWDVACVHAATRANVVYVRERDRSITTYRRRDEPHAARLARLQTDGADDGKLAAIPAADAPTWFAVLTNDLSIPKGSAGVIVDATDDRLTARVTAMDLVTELAPKSP